MKRTDIRISKEEIHFLQKELETKFGEIYKLNKHTYEELKTTSDRDSYESLQASMAVEIKKYPHVSSAVVATPGVSFLLNLFRPKKETFKIFYINACYLYFSGKIRSEYYNEQEPVIKPVINPKPVANYPKESPCFIHGISESIYHIRPATYDDIRKIYSIATTVYTGIDVIPHKTMLAWYEKNPCSFYVIVNEDGDVVGNIDILPLKEDVLHRFLNGEMIEREITEDAIWGMDEKEQINYLYVESVVNLAGKVALLELIRNLSEIFMNFDCDIKNIRKVYCISASSQGQRLIERFGFKLYENSDLNNRRDKHSVFESDLITILQHITSFFSDNSQHTDDYQRLKKLLNEHVHASPVA